MKLHKFKNYTTLLICLLTTSVMLTACSKPWIIKPDNSYLSNISIQSIEVYKSPGVDSDTIVAAIKNQLKEDTADLRGSKKVTMKVVIDYLTKPLPGGTITEKLLGSTKKLAGTVSILDGDKVIAKFKILAEHSEGGLLGKTTTISFIDTQNVMVKDFSAFTTGYMN